MRARRSFSFRALFISTLCATAVLTTVHLPANAALTLVAIPPSVPMTAVGSPSVGPVLAEGKLVGTGARATRIAAFLWPSQALAHKYNVGDTMISPLVGWTTVASDGTFALNLDTSRVPSAFVGTDGQINVHYMAWDGVLQGDWTESAYVTPSLGTASAALSAAGSTVATVTKPNLNLEFGMTKAPASSPTPALSADQLKSLMNKDSAVPQDNRPPTDYGYCAWTKTRTDVFSDLTTETHPRRATWGATLGSSHSQTVESAFNSSPTFGSFSASTGYSTSQAVQQDYAPYYADYYYYVELQYGRWREDCLGTFGMYTLRWAETIDYPTGGGARVATSVHPTARTYCTTWTSGGAGSWSRASAGATTSTYSQAIEAAGTLGIKLGMKTSWQATAGYERNVKAVVSSATTLTLCGNNGMPSVAAIVYEP